jgi:hypothetical protein
MIPPEYANAPLVNEAEVTLLGAGAYGESILCHIGNNHWIVVDSCVNPEHKDIPLPLEYLSNIGVPHTNIVGIICTHWHDDHIRGLSKILESAPTALFCISRAHDKNKFLAFVGMDSGKPINYSTKEFTNCLKLLIKRGQTYVDAIEDRAILRDDLSLITCLSPSDFTKQKFDKEISSLITEYGPPNKRIPYSSPNAKSIVLFAKLGQHRAIFGADLEISNNKNEGWEKVVKNELTIDSKSSLFKISHHGSVTGYHEEIWNKLLEKNPVAKFTPWKLGGKLLPEEEMIKKYLDHTEQLYITEFTVSNKQKSRDSQIEKLIKQHKPNLQEIKYKLGIIRSRITMDDENSKWNVENILGAKKIIKE